MGLDEVTQICPVPLPVWLSDSGGKGHPDRRGRARRGAARGPVGGPRPAGHPGHLVGQGVPARHHRHHDPGDGEQAVRAGVLEGPRARQYGRRRTRMARHRHPRHDPPAPRRARPGHPRRPAPRSSPGCPRAWNNPAYKHARRPGTAAAARSALPPPETAPTRALPPAPPGPMVPGLRARRPRPPASPRGSRGADHDRRHDHRASWTSSPRHAEQITALDARAGRPTAPRSTATRRRPGRPGPPSRSHAAGSRPSAQAAPGDGQARRAEQASTPAPARRWWKLDGQDRAPGDRRAARLGGAGVPARLRRARRHARRRAGSSTPLCLYAIDILAELWSVLYLAASRTPASCQPRPSTRPGSCPPSPRR